MQLAKYTNAGKTVPYKKEPVSDYNQSTFFAPQGSLLDSVGKRSNALGIKDYAWKGIPSETNSNHYTHHYDKKFLEQQRKH